MRVCPRCASETDLETCPHDGATTFAVQESQPTYATGTLIAGRYRVDGVIGLGGFGAVYRCNQLNMNQTVAVKVLRPEHLSSVEHVKRFSREAQAVSKLKHPNTIHIFDFGTNDDGALYLAMEYLEGETLADRLDRNRLIYWEAMGQIAIQISHSLTEAHALGLVHRDLKPENIMLMPVAGDPNFVKVLDFGIAKMQKDPTKPTQSNLTESGMIMGTPTYMSPEQAKGDPIDGRSDIYSLGVMMYEGLTGRAPFEDETAMKILVAHIHQPPPPFPRGEGVDDEVPVDIERVVLQCLEKDVTRRPQTTVQLVDRLMTALRRARELALVAADTEPRQPGGEGRTHAMPRAEIQNTINSLDAAAALQPLLFHAPSSAEVAVARMPEGPRRPERGPLVVAGGAFAAIALGVAVAIAASGRPPTATAPLAGAAAAPKVVAPAKPDETPMAALPALVVVPAKLPPAAPAKLAAEPIKVAADPVPAAAEPAHVAPAAEPAKAAVHDAPEAHDAKVGHAPAKGPGAKGQADKTVGVAPAGPPSAVAPVAKSADAAKPDAGAGKDPVDKKDGADKKDGTDKKDPKGGKDDFRLDDDK